MMPRPTRSQRIAVVGAGMSGIAAAHYLELAGHRPELIEAAPSLGGRAGSTRLGDRTIDVGGKNIGRNYRRFREFLRHHGSPRLEYFGINSSTVRDGRLHTVDSQRKLASLWHVFGLVGPRDFARLLALVRLVKEHPEEGLLGGPRFSELAERRDHLPLSAWFGAKATESLLRPVTLRMNGAEPDQYYLGSFGSNLKMLFDSYDQLAAGMSSVLERFAETAQVLLNTRVTKLLWSGSRAIGIEIDQRGARARREYDGVVLALPASGAAALLPDQPVRSALEGVSYNPVTLLVARYSRPIFDARVRAIVFDRASPVSNAGCYGASSLDIVRYTLSGRAATGIDDTSDPEAVLRLAEAELQRFLPVRAEERVDFVFKHFRRGLCAYGPYHHRTLQRLFAWERSVSGLVLTGDYVRGASIESCFESAFESVERLCRRAPLRDVSDAQASTPEPPSQRKIA